MARDLDKAVQTWKVFHKKNSTKLIKINGKRAQWPSDWECLGRCHTIYYHSDKWYENESYNYYHPHGTKVRIWVPAGVKGITNLPRQRVNDQKFPLKHEPDSLTILGDFLGYDLMTTDGGIIEAESKGVLLCCTPDRKKLVAFDQKHGISALIGGPGLRVEGRGVVG
jgi:hypothetical protein